MRRIVYALAFLGLNGALCTWPFQPDLTKLPPREATLAKFTSAEEMLNYLDDQVAMRTRSAGSSVGDGVIVANTVPGAATGTGNSASSGSGDAFSTTNIQEAGVDESDIVKNDGTFIYLLKSDSLRIVQAVPADALQEVGKLALDGTVDSFYLSGDKVIVLALDTSSSHNNFDYDKRVARATSGGSPGAIVTLVDVTDRSNPTIEYKWEFDANLVTSRLIGNKLHLVLTQTPSLTYDNEGQPVRWNSLDDLLPTYLASGGDGTTHEGKIADWSSCYHPSDAQGYGLTLVTTIDLANPSAEPQSSGITANAGVIYASPSALYVTSPQSGFWYTQRASETTTVHKFDLSGDRAIYVGGADVPGHLLNQYSLGEKDGFLRLGSTMGEVSRGGNGTAVNAVYVLGEGATEGQLEIVGKVEGIAPGEKIYSARFVGDRGFLVTFKKVDPLYTLDMSDPTNPRIVGQLKVPGYSDYIHPMDANHLLTIGKDAYDMGDFAWYQGVQLSIFDVTDFANPQLLAKEIIGVRGTESEANQNPKAFNYFASQSVLAIPIVLAEGPTSQPNEFGQHTFTGLYVYHTAVADGFSLLGRISTSTDSQAHWWYADARGIFIGDHVYAVTDSAVISAPTADPSQIQSSVSLQ